MTTKLQSPSEVQLRLLTIEKELNERFVDRRSAIEAVRLAILSKEHCTMLGPPGTGKTNQAQETFDRIVGAEFFACSLSKGRPAEAVLGPWDLPQYREHGNMWRKYQGFLPTAHFALLDEMGKMSPTLGHDLLKVLLDRQLDQVMGDGRSSLDLPLYTVLGGINELPTDDDTDAAALWDRILVRVEVKPIREASGFIKMLQRGPVGDPTTVDFASLADVIDNVVPQIPIGDDVYEALARLREALRGEEIDPSGRRWKQSMRLLQSAAFFAGRDQVEVDDIGALRFSLWDLPSQQAKVDRLTMSVSNPLAEKALVLLERVVEISGELRGAEHLSRDNKFTMGTQAAGNLKSIGRDLDDLRTKAQAKGASTSKIDEVADLTKAVSQRIVKEILDLDKSA